MDKVSKDKEIFMSKVQIDLGSGGGGIFDVDSSYTIAVGGSVTIPISYDCMFAAMSSSWSAFAFGSIIGGTLTKYNETYTTITYSGGNLTISNSVGAALTVYIAHN